MMYSGEKSEGFKFKKAYIPIVGVAILILLAVFILWFDSSNSTQAGEAWMAQVYFEGEYRIGDGEWKPIVKGEHISSTKGDVTLRGNFHMLDPLGNYVGIYSEEIPIAFHVNHINLTFREKNGEPIVDDIENHFWFGKFVCCENWVAHSFTQGNTDPIEIVAHNPHKFGNENAIDEMLSSVAIWGDMNFERDVESTGATQRTAGILFMVISFLFLGTALFSTLIHIKNSKIIWMLGALVLFAGLYFAYGADGVSFWSNSFVLNTAILGFSMMFYMLFLSFIIVSVLKETKIVGNIAVIILAVSNALFFVLPLFTNILFYDTWLWWAVIQIVINVTFAICLLKEFISSKEKARWMYLGALLPLIAFEADVIGTWRGAWQGGVASQCVFIILFIVAVIMVLKYIPQNINAASRAKELEMERIALDAELTESRMSTMMSQIRPHFIYNTLGSIEQLCDIDPKKAGELVHDFAKYLRGNFGELDNPKPILMSKEMDHVRHYVSIESVRFPDMTFTFEMNSDDFKIPALTVQPIVENAIKHGLMKLQKGGTIKVVSYETDTHYCISVVDDGVGFDASVMHDERKHVGLRNIRERLKSMVGGSLEIESTLGVGTKALVKIPKETK